MSTLTILNQAKTGKLISSIAKRATTLQVDIHIAAVSTLAHIRDHSDYTLAIRLLGALPSGQRVKTLALWYSHFSNGAITFTLDKAEGWKANLAKKRTPEMFDIEGAWKTTFGDLMPEKVPTTMTAKQVLAMLKKQADSKAVNDDGTPKISDDAKELFAQLFAAGSKMLADAEAENAKRAKAAARAASNLKVVPATPVVAPTEGELVDALLTGT